MMTVTEFVEVTRKYFSIFLNDEEVRETWCFGNDIYYKLVNKAYKYIEKDCTYRNILKAFRELSKMSNSNDAEVVKFIEILADDFNLTKIEASENKELLSDIDNLTMIPCGSEVKGTIFFIELIDEEEEEEVKISLLGEVMC